MVNDFIIQGEADAQSLTKHLLLNRIDANKPTILLITGQSGEGKSYSAIAILVATLKSMGLDFLQYMDDIIIYTPLEYAQKVDAILHDKKLKKIKVVMLDEAREIVKARTWNSFVNQAIADVNSMSRGIKPLLFLVITQSIKDIDPATRRTITFYGKCARPLHQSTRMSLYRLWFDDYNLEKPRLRKRRIVGVQIKDGLKQKIRPILKFHVPDREIIRRYEKMQFTAKSKLIRQKLDLLLSSLQKEFGSAFSKIDAMVSFYVEHPEALASIVERKRGKIKLNKNMQAMHDLTREEIKEFEKRMVNKLAERGLSHGVSIQED